MDLTFQQITLRTCPQILGKTDREDRVFIVHISDIGKMDGYKNHLLQQLIRLPRGTYKQLVVDLSCTDPAKQHFRKHLLQWGVDVVSECMQVPGPTTQGGWASIDEWHNHLAILDTIDSLEAAPKLMREVLGTLVNILVKADVLMITNGAGSYDSYLIPLGRLTNTKVVMDLGPRGPTMLPWTVRGLDYFVAQSTFVRDHPQVRETKVPVVTLPPIVDQESFSFPEAQISCRTEKARLLSDVPDAVVTFAYVARLASQKGPGMFIRAASKALNILGDPNKVRFVVVGIGPLQVVGTVSREVGRRGHFSRFYTKRSAAVLSCCKSMCSYSAHCSTRALVWHPLRLCS